MNATVVEICYVLFETAEGKKKVVKGERRGEEEV